MDVTNLKKLNSPLINSSPELLARLSQMLPRSPKTTTSLKSIIYGLGIPEPLLARIREDQPALYLLDVWTVMDRVVVSFSEPLSSSVQLLCAEYDVDFANFDDGPDLSKPGLALFDMDSTAIEIECIDEIAKRAGVGEKVSLITERAMAGELDFEQSLRERVAALAGTPVSILDEIRQQIPYMSGMSALVTFLKAHNWKVAIASGGFTWFSDEVKNRLELDTAISNQLEMVDGKLTGCLLGEVIDAQKKSDILSELSQEFDIPLANTIAVGDGANDLVMMATAGLGIAYHAKPKVQEKAEVSIISNDLLGVACILSASLFR